ncbi:hypothetical protein ACO0K2_11870 [Undibacterium sp. MH2W]|uniref:hypothetical protein n=1 Tax=Undibacterium sp. MH2W TaxID=3413044 RepID=UPI003BF0E3F0
MARINPDKAALEIAYKRLGITLSYSDAMKNPTYKKLIEARARAHVRQRDRFDLKKLQANDND